MGRQSRSKSAQPKEERPGARAVGARSVLPTTAAPSAKKRKSRKTKKKSERKWRKTRTETRTRVSLVFQDYEEVLFRAGSVRREEWFGEAANVRREQREAGVEVPVGLKDDEIWVDIDQIVRVYNGAPNLSDYEVEVEATDSEGDEETGGAVDGPEGGKGDEDEDEDMGEMGSFVAGEGWQMILPIR